MSAPALRFLSRTLVTRGRLAGLGGLCLLALLVGAAGAAAGDDTDDAVRLVEVAGLGLFAPLTTLVLASAVLGDHVEDQTLVYLWMRPVARWRLALAAQVSASVLALPFVVPPLVLMALVQGEGADLAAGAGVAGVLAVGAYGGLFVALGVRTTRSLLWGLVYVLVWEGIVASVGSTLARTSLRLHLESVLREVAGLDPTRFGVDAAVAVAVLAAVTLAGWAVTTWSLATSDVA